MNFWSRTSAVVLTMMLGMLGCESYREPALRQAGQPERWTENDNPALFDENLEMSFQRLPLTGQARRIPWPGYYWATYRDSINLRWAGGNTDSPAKKYEKAFGLGTDLEQVISRSFGIESIEAPTCTTSEECDQAKNETCAKRREQATGRCIPTWFGICHGWAPAAILEAEPMHQATYNGVMFQVNDLKALATLLYTDVPHRFLSGRCEDSGEANGIALDAYGRPQASECRDTNPGTFHSILTNYLGLRGQSLVEDRVYDAEVWNQPLRGYQVLQSRSLSRTEANAMLGVRDTDRPVVRAAVRGAGDLHLSDSVARKGWKVHGPFAPQAAAKTLLVRLSGHPGLRLFVRFGLKPTERTYHCADVRNTPDKICELPINGRKNLFVGVKGPTIANPAVVPYGLTISFPGSPNDGGDDDNGDGGDSNGEGEQPPEAPYPFNPEAVQFRYLQTKVLYITESRESSDGPLAGSIDAYTMADTYEYILELDAQGLIIGGEWLGANRKNHPDFLWLPTGEPYPTTAEGFISYENVKRLLELSTSSR